MFSGSGVALVAPFFLFTSTFDGTKSMSPYFRHIVSGTQKRTTDKFWQDKAEESPAFVKLSAHEFQNSTHGKTPCTVKNHTRRITTYRISVLTMLDSKRNQNREHIEHQSNQDHHYRKCKNHVYRNFRDHILQNHTC